MLQTICCTDLQSAYGSQRLCSLRRLQPTEWAATENRLRHPCIEGAIDHALRLVGVFLLASETPHREPTHPNFHTLQRYLRQKPPQA